MARCFHLALGSLTNQVDYFPRDHFCSHTQTPAAKSQPIPMSGIPDINVHTAALIRHNITAKTPMRILVTDSVSTTLDARDNLCHAAYRNQLTGATAADTKYRRRTAVLKDGLGILLRVLAPFRIPKLHALPLLDGLGPAERQAAHDHQHFADRMCAQFPPGRGDGLPQDHELAIAL